MNKHTKNFIPPSFLLKEKKRTEIQKIHKKWNKELNLIRRLKSTTTPLIFVMNLQYFYFMFRNNKRCFLVFLSNEAPDVSGVKTSVKVMIQSAMSVKALSKLHIVPAGKDIYDIMWIKRKLHWIDRRNNGMIDEIMFNIRNSSCSLFKMNIEGERHTILCYTKLV